MSEVLPSLRYQRFPVCTRGADLGGQYENNWISYDTERQTEKAFLGYNFTSSSGYQEEKRDHSCEGQGVKFDYDLANSLYSKKRQFILGIYAYFLTKNFTHSGSLPSGNSFQCYTTGALESNTFKFKRNISSYDLLSYERLLDNIQLNAYNPVSFDYIYPQIGVATANLYTNKTYKANAEVTFCGIGGEFPPYCDIVAEDVIPYTNNHFPNNCFVDKSDDITLSWDFAYESSRLADFEGFELLIVGGVYGDLKQKSAILRWTQDDGATIHEVSIGEENSYTIPAGSITADSFKWQVKVCSDDDVWSEDDDVWFYADTVNDSISSAKAVYPAEITIDGLENNVFRWEHIIESNSRPTAADFQYSIDGGSFWVNFYHYNGRVCECIIPAKLLPAYDVLWRVRTYNSVGVAGEWSEAVSINVRGIPNPPSITSVSDRPFPEIFWEAEDQALAEISIDGNVMRIYGSLSFYRWPELVLQGSHSLKIRTQNSYGLWSDWTEKEFSVVNTPSSQVSLDAQSNLYSVHLSWDKNFNEVYIYRNSSLIAKVLGSQLSFDDLESLGSNEYTIYAVDFDGSYTRSNCVSAAPLINSSALGKDNLWIEFDGRFNKIVGYSADFEKSLDFKEFLGRNLPAFFSSDLFDNVHSFTFSIRKNQLFKLNQLRSFLGELVIYKDFNICISGVLSKISCKDCGDYFDISFSIVEAQRGDVL